MGPEVAALSLAKDQGRKQCGFYGAISSSQHDGQQRCLRERRTGSFIGIGPIVWRGQGDCRPGLPDGLRALRAHRPPARFLRPRRLAGLSDGPEVWLQRIAAGWHELAGKRAVLLVQLPPSLPRDDARLAYFLGLVRGWMRVAVEFRHPSWQCEEIFALLEGYRAAYCVMSGANLPCVLRATTDFVYVRMHGPDHHHLYAGSYPDADMAWWADRIGEWDRAGQDVFVYFNNDGNANAVRNARTLQALLMSEGTSHPSTSMNGSA